MTKHPSQSPFLPYGKQTIDQDDIDAVVETLHNDFLTTGPKIAEFERSLAEIVGAQESVVVGNGTQALHLACMAAGLGPGDFAVVPTLTFLATANAVRYCGADVLFCDVDPQTGIMDIHALESLLTSHSDKSIKAVLPVHLGGQLADLQSIRKLSDRYNFKIIADSCHALGSTKEDYVAGSCKHEDMSAFSFHPVKTIAMGEGGAITLNDSELAQNLRKIRSHGMNPKPEAGIWAYDMNELGYNYRITDIQCALGISQLKKLDKFIEKRRKLAELYDEILGEFSSAVLPPHRIEDQNPAWHLYALRIDFDALGMSRDSVMRALRDLGVGTQVHYIPVHTQPYYKELYGEQTLNGAEHYYERTLSLPLFPAMEEEDVQRVALQLRTVIS